MKGNSSRNTNSTYYLINIKAWNFTLAKISMWKLWCNTTMTYPGSNVCYKPSPASPHQHDSCLLHLLYPPSSLWHILWPWPYCLPRSVCHIGSSVPMLPSYAHLWYRKEKGSDLHLRDLFVVQKLGEWLHLLHSFNAMIIDMATQDKNKYSYSGGFLGHFSFFQISTWHIKSSKHHFMCFNSAINQFEK